MFKTHFWRTFIFALVGALLGFITYQAQPKVYEANVEMLLGESPVSNNTSVLDPQVQRILETGVARDAQTELQLLRSQTVFFGAFRNSVEQLQRPSSLLENWLDYYLKYDVISVEQRAGVMDVGSVAQVRVRAYDTELAEAIAGQVAQVYNDLRLSNARNGSANAIRYLSAQVDSADKTLKAAEARYKEYTAQEGIVNIDISATQLQNFQANTLSLVNQLHQQLAGAEKEVTAIQGQLNETPKTILASSTDQRSNRLANMEVDLSRLRQERDRLIARYYEDHPKVVEINKSIAELTKAVEEEKKKPNDPNGATTTYNPLWQQLEQSLTNAIAKRDSLAEQVGEGERNLADANTKVGKLPEAEAELRNRRRDLEVADSNYRRVKVQFDELKNRTDTGSRTSPILSDPQAFKEPVAPQLDKSLFIGLIAGICVGLIFSFSLESLRLRVHNSAQLSELTGLPVVATVPKLGAATRGAAAFAKPGAKPGESFRHMAYTMLAKADHEGPKTIMFTAIGPAQSRPASTMQFAMAMAATGKRVLLVDGDSSKGLITKAFGADGRSGLSELIDRSKIGVENDDVFVATPHENLTLLGVGADNSKSLADRSTSQIEEFMNFVSSKADLVVFDMPPCDIFSDASRIASYVDEVCLVLSAASTNYQAIPNGYEILSRAGAKNVSLILTDASTQDEPFGDVRKYARGA